MGLSSVFLGFESDGQKVYEGGVSTPIPHLKANADSKRGLDYGIGYLFLAVLPQHCKRTPNPMVTNSSSLGLASADKLN